MNSISAKETRFDERLLETSATMDEFEGYRHPHGRRIAVIADALAERFNFASHDRSALSQAALVHDIGEMVMNRDYIGSNKSFREEERLDMQRHTVIANRKRQARLGRADSTARSLASRMVARRGYPDAARTRTNSARRANSARCRYILRGHRRAAVQTAMSSAEAKKHLIEWAGIDFDPKIVKTFLSLKD